MFAFQTWVKVFLGLLAIVLIIAAVIGIVVRAQHHGQSTAAVAVTPSSSLVSTSQPTLYALCHSVIQCVAMRSLCTLTVMIPTSVQDHVSPPLPSPQAPKPGEASHVMDQFSCR